MTRIYFLCARREIIIFNNRIARFSLMREELSIRYEIELNFKLAHILSMHCSVVPVVKLAPIMRHPTARIGTIRRCNKLP